MAPDDPRHGEYAGAVQHWFDKERPCADCARAEWRYRKTRELRHLRGESPNVPSIGTVRRYQALMALGWTGPQIAAECGISIYSLRSISYHGSSVVRRETAAAVAATFERLSMTLPEGDYANRARAIARNRGWPPPLAWDDIDNPNERPRGWQYAGTDRASEMRDLDTQGVGITEACRRLGTTKSALEKWTRANPDLRSTYNRMCGREFRYTNNQHTEDGAA